MRFHYQSVLAGLILFPGYAIGQGATSRATPVPIRALAITARSDSGVFANVTDVHELPGGRVLVNDRVRRQVLLLDSSLSSLAIVFGSAPNVEGRYTAATRLLAYGPESTVFVDRDARSLAVIGPNAKVARIMAAPKARDLPYMANPLFGTAGFDPSGRIVYQGANVQPPETIPSNYRGDTSKLVVFRSAIKGPVVRGSFATSIIDTLAWLELPFEKTTAINNIAMDAWNPLPATDDWTLLPDGTVAILRWRDYHLDWISPDGTMRSTPRMPFEWRAISFEEKQRIHDSTQLAVDSLMARQRATSGDYRGPGFSVVDVADLPDFYPPFRAGQMRADANGNLWLLPSTTRAAADGLLYDIVNREGAVVQRARLPAGRVLLGFGSGGTIYLRHVLSRSDERLEEARIVP